MRINETIVVEGRDDERAVKQAVQAEVIITHGYGIKASTFKRIDWAREKNGVIVFTDPDTAGEMIRKQINKRVKGCKNAFLAREEAIRKENIGIENANAVCIREALKQARCIALESTAFFSMEDLVRYSLANGPGAAANREKTGQLLRIGYGNAKQFLKRLNHYGITREEFLHAVE
ncbi:MAG: ribonuclease M5 [Desulfobacteraceae bacterium]